MSGIAWGVFWDAFGMVFGQFWEALFGHILAEKKGSRNRLGVIFPGVSMKTKPPRPIPGPNKSDTFRDFVRGFSLGGRRHGRSPPARVNQIRFQVRFLTFFYIFYVFLDMSGIAWGVFWDGFWTVLGGTFWPKKKVLRIGRE